MKIGVVIKNFRGVVLEVFFNVGEEQFVELL